MGNWTLKHNTPAKSFSATYCMGLVAFQLVFVVIVFKGKFSWRHENPCARRPTYSLLALHHMERTWCFEIQLPV